MSRSLLTALTLVLLATVGLVPASAETTMEQDVRTFFLTNTGTACGADAKYELLEEARTGGPNCGYIGGLPFGEVFTQSGAASAMNTYAAPAGTEFVLDATEDVAGQVTIMHASGTTGAGQIVIDLALRARQDRSTKTLATDTVEYLIAGDVGTSEVPFTLDLDDTFDRAAFSSLQLEVTVRGVHANTGYTSSQGDSMFDLPVLIVPETTTTG